MLNWKKLAVMSFLLMAVIGMSFGVIFSGFSQEARKVKYNGITFKAEPVNNVWIAKINNKYAGFSYLPQEVESIEVIGNPFELLKGKFEIDITSAINNTNSQSIALAQHQMTLTLKEYEIFIMNGFTGHNKFEYPVISCSNATSLVPVIYFMESNSTRIGANGNCVIAEAPNSADYIRVKDRIVYGILGVIK